jgi:hypothetical protein
MDYRMQLHPYFTDFACGAPLPFGDLMAGIKLLLVLLQKVIVYPLEQFAFMRCLLIACNADQNLQYRWENLDLYKKWK